MGARASAPVVPWRKQSRDPAQLVAIIRRDRGKADDVEFAVEELRLSLEQSEVTATAAISAGAVPALCSVLSRDELRDDELLVRGALRALMVVAGQKQGVAAMSGCGALKLLEGDVLERWAESDDIAAVMHAVVKRCRKQLAEAAIKALSGGPRSRWRPALQFLLSCLSENIYSAPVVVAALRQIPVAIAHDGDRSGGALTAERLRSLVDVPRVHGASLAIMACFTDAVCELCWFEEGRRNLFKAGVTRAVAHYLTSLVDAKMSTDLLQLALFVLSELMRDPDDQLALLVVTMPGVRLRDAVTAAQSRGELVVPFPLIHAANRREQLIANARARRDSGQDLRDWRLRHFNEASTPRSHELAELAAFRRHGLFAAEAKLSR